MGFLYWEMYLLGKVSIMKTMKEKLIYRYIDLDSILANDFSSLVK